MSDDELEKLAAAMKNISPSKAARKSGMEAAMAAFDTEFASETAVVTEAAEENISETSQGLSDAPRLTGQTISTGPMASLGRDTMSRVKEFFTFKPKTMMMMGTCAAALFATSLYIPNTSFEDMPKPTAKTVAAEVGTEKAVSDTKVAEVDESVVKDAEVPEVAPTVVAEIPAAVEAPLTETPALETSKTAPTPSGDISGPAEPRTDIAVAEALTVEPKVIEVPVAADPVIVTPSTSDTEVVLPSDTVIIERRVLKSPARTMERAVPTIPKTVTRRRVKTPASTVERSVPAVTKQETRRVAKEDGTFETVTETVIVTPQSVEYVTIPPVYELSLIHI